MGADPAEKPPASPGLGVPSNAPRLTVLLPTHDRADVVGYAIRSVLGQTFMDFELLVVGDGCTDDTAAVVTSFGDPRVRWFDLPKAPAFGYANRNGVLRQARGELIAFMAHDDLYLPDHLELLAAPFTDERVALAYSRPVWVSREGVMIPLPVDLRQADQMRWFREVGNTIPASCVVYRRTSTGRAGDWPEDVARAADRVLWTRILDEAGDAGLAFVAEATCLHFVAHWRPHTHRGPAPFDAWMRTVRPGSGWPGALQVPIPAGRPEQAAVWERIKADPAGWTAAFRASSQEALDLLAWHGAQAIQAGLKHDREVAGLEARIAALGRQRDAAAAGVAELRQGRLDAMRERAASDRLVSALQSSALGRIALQRSAHGTTPGRGWLAMIGGAAPMRALRGRLANPLFDARWYRERYPDVRLGRLPAWIHWRRHGWREGRDPNPLFDTDWYVERYPDVGASGIDPLEHYLRWGAGEERDPGPQFDARWYRQRHADVRVSGMNPLLHYLRHGRSEGRQIRPVDRALAGGDR